MIITSIIYDVEHPEGYIGTIQIDDDKEDEKREV